MNESLWILSSKGMDYEKLNENIQCNIVIVGGGIVGVTLAYLLNKKGIEVTLVDADKIGEGCSGRNTGKITVQHNIIYSKLKEKQGEDIAKFYYEENNKALLLIENIIKENKIKCDFKKVNSYLFTENDEVVDLLRTEKEVCEDLGIKCDYIEELNLPLKIKAALCFKNQAQFNPKKFIDSLGKIISDNGVKIYENTPLIDMDKGKVCKIKTKEGFIIEAKSVIIASHSPWYDDMGLYFAKQKAERSYVVAGEYNGDFHEGIYINVEEPRKSFALYEHNKEKLLISCGENHKVGQGRDYSRHFEELEKMTTKHFGEINFKYRWSAQDYVTPDNIPYIGYLSIDSNNIYIATGFSKWGITNGVVAANIITNMITNNFSGKEEILSPFRKGIINFSFFKENINIILEYIKGKIKLGDKEFPKEAGEGKIVVIDGSKYGAYIDFNNKIYLVDVTCTHLGCELLFNNDEKTWDCPCHGSRFNYDGTVLEGPATNPLRSYGEGANDINPHII